MTLEEALAIARDNYACDQDLNEIEHCGTWEKVLSHKDALFWVRWFVDYLPTGLHPARDAYHFRMRAARKEMNEAYREAMEVWNAGDTATYQTRADAWAEKFDAARKAASGALLVEIKKYLEIEEPQSSCGAYFGRASGGAGVNLQHIKRDSLAR